MTRKRASQADEPHDAETEAQQVDINLNIKQPPPRRTRETNAPIVDEPSAYEPEYEFDAEEPTGLLPEEEFEYRFRHLQGHYFNLVRRPDPPDKQNGGFLRDCNMAENYGRMIFNPATWLADIRRRMRSGGLVKVTLVDVHSRFVRDGSVMFIVADPADSEIAHASINASAPVSETLAQPAAPLDPLQAMISQLEMAKALKSALRDDDEPTKRSPQDSLNESDRIMLAVAKDSNLLPTVMGSVATSIAATFAAANQATGAKSSGKESTLDQTLKVLDFFGLQTRAPMLLDRVVSRFLPDPEVSEDMETAEDALFEYCAEQCIANAPVSLDDEAFVNFRISAPGNYDVMLGMFQKLSRRKIIAHFISGEPSPLTVALKSPHASAWVDNLKRIANGHAWI
jgi:hypothetical protein